MPRTFTFTPNDQDQIFAITVIRDELTVVNVSDGNTKLQLSISTTRGGSPIIQIPSTGGKFDLRPSLLESLDEGMTYQHNIWDYSNSVDGKRIATGTFTHAESIKSVDIAYPTVTLADGTLRIFVTQAQYDAIDPKLPNVEYVISDAAIAPGEGNAPTAANALADQSYTQSTGDKTINAALDFQNASGGTWSVSGAGATISAAGIVTIPTNSLRSAATVTVTYTNGSGTASSAFSVTVEAVAALPQEPGTATAIFGAVAPVQYHTGENGAWTTLANAVADDATSASYTGSTIYGFAPSLRFTMGPNGLNVPAGARIDGLKITLQVASTDGSGGRFFSPAVGLVFGEGPTTAVKYCTQAAAAVPFRPATNGALETMVFGGAADTWNGALTPDRVNAANFGLDVQLQQLSATASTFKIRRVQVEVNYTTNALQAVAFDTLMAAVDIRPDKVRDGTLKIKIPGRVAQPATMLFACEANEGVRSSSGVLSAERPGMALNLGVMVDGGAYFVSTKAMAIGTSYDAPGRPPRYQAPDLITDTNNISFTGIDGRTLSNFTNQARVFNFIAMPLYADQVHLNLKDGDDLINGAYDVITGFAADTVLAFNGQQRYDSGSHGSWSGYGMGAAKPSGGGNFTQKSMAVEGIAAWLEVGVPTKGVTAILSDAIGFQQNAQEAENYTTVIKNGTATGYTLEVASEIRTGTGVPGANPNANWGLGTLAIKWPAGVGIDFGFGAAPAVAGAATVDFGVTGTPKAAVMFATLATAQGVQGAPLVGTGGTLDAGGFGLIAADGKNTLSMAGFNTIGAEVVAAAGTKLRIGSAAIAAHDGAAAHTLGPVAMAAGGVSANWTVAPAAANYWLGIFSV